MKTDRFEAVGVREIGDRFHANLPAPQIARHLTVRRDRELGEHAVLLSPRGFLAVGEVESANGLPLLPPSVAWWIGAVERIAAVGSLAPPEPGDGDRVDVHYVVGDSSSAETSLATRR